MENTLECLSDPTWVLRKLYGHTQNRLKYECYLENGKLIQESYIVRLEGIFKSDLKIVQVDFRTYFTIHRRGLITWESWEFNPTFPLMGNVYCSITENGKKFIGV